MIHRMIEESRIDMTQSQVQCFLIVARELNISRASEILFVSQPAVSRQIAQLEAELGIELFARKNHRLYITEAGKAFQEFFFNYNREFEELKMFYQEKARKTYLDYYMGCLEGWDISRFYSDLQKRVGEYNAAAVFHIKGYNMDRMYYALKNGKIDAALTLNGLFDGFDDISSEPVTEVDTVILYSAHHPLADRDETELTLKDFKEYSFCVTAPVGFKGAFRWVEDVCREAGFVPKFYTVETLSEGFMQLQTGNSVLMANSLMMGIQNKIFRSFHIPKSRRICLAKLKNRDSAVGDLIYREIADYFKALDPKKLIQP